MFKSMKDACMRFFCKKTINTRIKEILFVSLALVLAGLLLSGCYGVALVLVFVTAIAYLSAVYFYRVLESKMAYRYERVFTQLANIQYEVLDMLQVATPEIKGKIKEHYELTNKSLVQLHEKCEALESKQTLLINSVLPELGIVIEEENQEKEWIQCDILGRDIPILVFPDKVRRKLVDNGIIIYADLVKYSEKQFMQIPFFGRKSVLCLSALLEAAGLQWEMKVKCEEGKWYYYNIGKITDDSSSSDDLL